MHTWFGRQNFIASQAAATYIDNQFAFSEMHKSTPGVTIYIPPRTCGFLILPWEYACETIPASLHFMYSMPDISWHGYILAWTYKTRISFIIKNLAYLRQKFYVECTPAWISGGWEFTCWRNALPLGNYPSWWKPPGTWHYSSMHEIFVRVTCKFCLIYLFGC